MIKVMVVARSLDVQEGLCTVLDLAEDMEVVSLAKSPDEALKKAYQTFPDVALVDLEMMGDEGFEILLEFHFHCPFVRTIALTAHDIPSVMERALQCGALMVMVKGMDVPDMLSIIQTASHAQRTHGTQRVYWY